MLFVTDRRTATTRASQGSPFARDFPAFPSVNSVSSVVKSVRSKTIPHPQFYNSTLFTLLLKPRQRVTPPKPKSRSSTLQPTPLFSTSSALFPPTGNPQLALFQSLPHSFPSHGRGWGGFDDPSCSSHPVCAFLAPHDPSCKLFSSVLAPFHRICTPMHTSRNDESRKITFIPVGPTAAASRSANP